MHVESTHVRFRNPRGSAGNLRTKRVIGVKSSRLPTNWTTFCLKTSQTESGDGTTFGISLVSLGGRGNASLHWNSRTVCRMGFLRHTVNYGIRYLVWQ